MPIIIWSLIGLFATSAAVGVAVKSGIISINLPINSAITQPTPDPIPTSSPNSTPIPIPKKVQPVYVDPDPLEPCTSKNSGDSIKVRRSECQNKYVDCHINNTWKVLTKDDCNQAQKQGNTYIPHTIPTYNSSVQTVSCALSYGTYQLTQSDCDNSKKSDTPQNQQQVPTPIPQDTKVQLDQCLRFAADQYTLAQQQAFNLYKDDLGNRDYEAYQNKNTQNRIEALDSCHHQWGQ